MIPKNSGRYHSAGSAQSQASEVSLINGNLYIYLTESNNQLLIWNVKHIHACSFQGSTLIVFFGTEPYQTLELTGELALSVFNLFHGISNENSFESTKKISRTLVWIIVVAISFFIFSWFYLIPWLGEKSAALIPIDVEIKMGEGIAANVSEGSLVNDSATYYANLFLNQLEKEDTYPISIEVLESKDINAIAAPGGKIIIYSAILEKMTSAEELAALLGHELTHINQRHSLKSICRALASNIVLSAMLGNAGGISSSILSQVDQFKSLNYSRELETEADLQGLHWMLANNINPNGMLKLLNILKETSEKEPGFMKYLSTHPETDERIRIVKEGITKDKVYSENQNLEHIFQCIKTHL